MINAQQVKTITQYHKLMNLPSPKHPLVSVINYDLAAHASPGGPQHFMFDFYSISIKRNFDAKMKYGQLPFDFDEGLMFFIAPGQLFSMDVSAHSADTSGWGLLIHPDFLWGSALAGGIKKYDYFGYHVTEALFLSEQEESTVVNILKGIEQEHNANIDHFSQQIIVSQIETLLNYAERFYRRQFITRQKANHQILDKLKKALEDSFSEKCDKLPTVQSIARQLNLSPNYLNGILKANTGETAQEYIHKKLIEKAQEKLSTTTLSVSEIAYELGFEYPQSFSKLFKNKTKQTPLEFRSRFN